jgi:hypothetical protein
MIIRYREVSIDPSGNQRYIDLYHSIFLWSIFNCINKLQFYIIFMIICYSK